MTFNSTANIFTLNLNLVKYSINNFKSHSKQRARILIAVYIVLFSLTLSSLIAIVIKGNSTTNDASQNTNQNNQPDTMPPIEPSEEDRLKDLNIYTPVDSSAKLYLDDLKATGKENTDEYKQISQIAQTPSGIWLTDDDGEDSQRLQKNKPLITDNDMVLFVLYNIPHIFCDNNGATDKNEYMRWIDSLISQMEGIKNLSVVIEPDALSLLDCLDETESKERIESIAYAASKFNEFGAYTFIDAGHSEWKDISLIGDRLKQVGVSDEIGFSLNVSNFQTDDSVSSYANQLISYLGISTPYVIDTSRSGVGPTDDQNWCNPRERALGSKPELIIKDNLFAHFWIKVPGESDGTCGGGPEAGVWWPEYATELVRNSVYNDSIN